MSNRDNGDNTGSRPPHSGRRGRPEPLRSGHTDRRSAPTISRLLATRVLERVERTQAFADLALRQALARSQLSSADRGLTTELVYGTLRQRGRLDFYLQKMLNQSLESLEPLVASTLRLGAYQLIFTDRIPESAAVDQAVRCARAVGSSRASGLVNAVLRRLAREWKEIEPPNLEADPLGHLTHALSMPEWIAKRLLDQYDPGEAAAFAQASNQPAPITIRANRLRGSRDELLAQMVESDIEARVCAIAPDAIRLGHTGRDPGCDPLFRDGVYTIQDEASQLVVCLLDPQPGEQILDTCAAPGTKTTAIAERLGDQGSVLALDRNARRLGLVSRSARRLSLSAIHVLQRDATQTLQDLSLAMNHVPGANASFDRILVDAPCSGLGSLRRNPDARWRIREGDPARLAALQARLLSRAAAVLRPGGSLVYSTCTILPEENELLIQRFLEQNPKLRQLSRNELPDHLAPVLGEDGAMHCSPQHNDTDGFFAVRLERSE